MILVIVLELWGRKWHISAIFSSYDVSFQIFIFFKQLSPQNKSTRTIHRLLITFQIWFHLIYRSFDANHRKITKLWHFTNNKTDFVSHFSKNVDAILPKCFKTWFSVVSFWYLIWGLTVVLIYLKKNTSKQMLHSLMYVRRWYWWCHQKSAVIGGIIACAVGEEIVFHL